MTVNAVDASRWVCFGGKVASILAVDQDTLHTELVKVLLKHDGHDVQATMDPEAAVEILLSTPVDLVIIEPALSGHEGERVCQQLRQLDPQVPIMIVSHWTREDQVVSGLLFADDYVRKPILPREFLARVTALLRRTRLARTPVGQDQNVSIGEIELNLNQMHAVVNDSRIPLTRREFSLLYVLMDNCNRVLTRDQLIEQAWGHEFLGIAKTVDVCILRIRRKLQPHLRLGNYIQTTRGFGYRFEMPSQSPASSWTDRKRRDVLFRADLGPTSRLASRLASHETDERDDSGRQVV